MRKFIKKILNLIGWLLLGLIFLSVALSILINTPKVQNYITSTALEQVDSIFGSRVKYANVKLRLFNKAEFEELLIIDQNNDTLIYAPVLKASLPGIMKKVVFDKSIPIRLGKLHFEDSYFRIYADSTDLLNLRFIVDTIKSKKNPNKIPEPFYIDNIKIKNSRLDIHRFHRNIKDYGVEFTQLSFLDLNINVTDFRAYTDTVQMSVKNLSFVEQSGFNIKSLETKIHISNQQLYFDEVAFQTPQSKMNLDNIHFDFDSYQDFSKGKLYDLVRLDLDFKHSILSLEDLAFFTRAFKDMDSQIKLTGSFYGPISNLNARHLSISYGDNTFLNGHFDIIGLPNGKETFLIFNIDEFNTTTQDLISIRLPNNKKIDLPDRFSEVEYYSYKGNFTGFFNDFVSYGTIETNLGHGKLDILFKPYNNSMVSFVGNLSTQEFNIGAISGSPEVIGNIACNVEVDGVGTIDKGFEVGLLGDIVALDVNEYTYENIKVDGSFSSQKFNGELEINDENLRMQFNGLLDFSSQVRKYNFTANVFHSNLHQLNIHKKDSNYTASFLVSANLAGNKLDEINGEVKLLNSLFSKSDGQIQVYDLSLNIRNDSIRNELNLVSDFLDGEIVGHFKLTHLVNEYLYLFDTYLPSLGLYKPKEELLITSDFKYQINFKNSLPLFSYFAPNYMVNPRTIIEGELQRGEKENAQLHIISPEIRINKSVISDLVLNSETSDSSIALDFGCSEFNLNKRLTLDNFTFLSSIDSNEVLFEARWLNWDSSLHKGKIGGLLAFNNLPDEKIRAKVNLDSSVIVISDSVWVLRPFNFTYDSNFIALNGFNLSHNQEYFTAHGVLKDNSEDTLFCDFHNFNFSNLNFFTRSSTFKFGGVLNGEAVIKGYKRPLFIASLNIDSLILNNELIGDTYIDTKWNNEKESVEIEAKAYRGNLETLNINGEYYPTKNNELNLALNFNKFRLNFINPYLNTVFSDIRGLTTGILTVTGTTRSPSLNGNLNLQKAALTVDYLNTRYNFTSEIGIANNNFVFDGVELYDEYINTATLNGIIRTEYLKNFNLNLSIQPHNFLCLNTSRGDNDAFFGKAFATGLIRINGPSSELKFDITATTEPGTIFSIPLSDSEELAEYNYIKMINTDTLTIQEEKEEYRVNLSGMQLDFDLNVTPDAEVNIIFDPTVGDIITTRGNGKLRISINSIGNFKMLGDYVIESGTYLFTLKDILLNKKFKVEEGSNLQWTGDPLNANIDIKTYYRTKALLSDLTANPNDNNRYTVDCQLGLRGKLMQPAVNYNLYLPFSEQTQRDELAAQISSNEDMGKQFLSLLVLNRFLPSVNDPNAGFDNTNIASVNASEFLLNQVSNWLSQISDEFDIGVNYRPGTAISSDELEFALSTQLLNDRLTINGSVDMKTNAEVANANNILGNLDLDYKITKNGKLRARAYNRANDEIVTYSPYTQGIGLFYTEEFDKFNEIGSWYRKDSGKKKRKKKKNVKGESAVLREDDKVEKD